MNSFISTCRRLKDIIRLNKSEITAVALILSAGAILRFLHLLDYSQSPVFDSPVGPDIQEYFDWASRICAGEIFWSEVPIHAPLYPFFLALLMQISSMNIFAVRMMQSLFCMLSFLPFYIILRDVFPSSEKGMRRFIPAAFLLMICVYPPLIAYQSEFFSENLMLPLFASSLLFMHFYFKQSEEGQIQNASSMLILSGMSAVLAAVSHPSALFFVAASVVFIFIKNISSGFVKAIRPTAFFILPCIIVIGLVSAYNSHLAGHPVLIQRNSAFNFYLGNNPASTGTCSIPPGPVWDAIHSEADKSGISPDTFFMGRSLDFITGDFVQWLRLILRKTLYAFNSAELTTWSDISPLKILFIHKYFYSWPFALIAIPGLTSLIFGSFYICGYARRLQYFILLFLPFATLQVIFLTSGRYRLALIPPLIAASAYLICSAAEFFRDRKHSLMFCATLLAASVIVLVPVPPSDKALEAAHADSALAESYFKIGDMVQAEKHLSRSFGLLSNWDRTANLMGQIKYAQGDAASSVKYFSSAMKDFPESCHAFMNMGTVMSDSGDFASANELYAQALKRAPRSAQSDILFNIGEMEHRRRNTAKASEMYDASLKINPLNRRALNNLGTIRVSEGNYGEAVRLFRKALTLEPSNPKLMVNLAFAEMLSGNKTEALRLAMKALSLDSGSKPAAELVKTLSE